MAFQEYANYYDLLYADKDYNGETDYISNKIIKYAPNARTILDLGCGTGKHSGLLAKKGYLVTGVDFSTEMLAEANKHSNKNNPKFVQGDIQKLSLNDKFDVALAMFHVMSYQITKEGLENTFRTVKNHLNKEGVFIFDCWYGPAVLAEKPEIRIKKLENEKISIVRIAEPLLKENDNIVEVNYTVFIENKLNGNINKVAEKHVMRYIFKNEIEELFDKNNLKFIDNFEFMTDNNLSLNTWGGMFVGKV